MLRKFSHQQVFFLRKLFIQNSYVQWVKKALRFLDPGMSVHFHLCLKYKCEKLVRVWWRKTIYKHCEVSAAKRNVMEMNT